MTFFVVVVRFHARYATRVKTTLAKGTQDNGVGEARAKIESSPLGQTSASGVLDKSVRVGDPCGLSPNGGLRQTPPAPSDPAATNATRQSRIARTACDVYSALTLLTNQRSPDLTIDIWMRFPNTVGWSEPPTNRA